MGYLITQISLFMLFAALTGAIIGWLLGYGMAVKQNKQLTHHKPLFLQQNPVTIQNDRALSDAQGCSQPIESIETINPALIEQLKDEPFMIATTLHLLEACQTPDQRRTLALQLSRDVSAIGQWASIADLMRLPEMDFLNASLLEETAIQSVQDLARCDAVFLTAQLTETHVRHHSKDSLPNAKIVSAWINNAQQLQSLLSHS